VRYKGPDFLNSISIETLHIRRTGKMKPWIGKCLFTTFLFGSVLGSEVGSSTTDNQGGPSYFTRIDTKFEYGSEIPVVKEGGGFYKSVR